MPGPASITSTLIFALPPPDGTRPYLKTIADPKTGKHDRNYDREERTVLIENLRRKSVEIPTLDTAGFQLFHRPARHTTFISDEEIEKEYYSESVELLKELTGATRVVLFDHTIRRRRPGVKTSGPSGWSPVPYVHGDHTTKSAVARVHKHLPAADVPALLQKRFQIINLWRPIGHPALDWPLGLCDYRSVDPEKDTFPITLLSPDGEREFLGVKYNENQKWSYFYGVEPENFILLKCFDSVQDGSVATFIPHAAFKDPATPEATPPRESIELRALVFYE